MGFASAKHYSDRFVSPIERARIYRDREPRDNVSQTRMEEAS
jgi:hypothetical protein